MKTLELRFLLVGGLTLLTIVCGLGLSGSYVSADDSYNADVSLTIPVACTMTGTLDTPHTANVNAGTYVADIGTTTLKTVCNDGNGFSIYAIGYSGLEYGNNKMLATVGGTLAPTYDIATGTATSGDTSNWAMKLNAVTGTYAPTLTNGFGSYRTVPTEYTKVATLLSGTDATIGSSVQSTYAVYVTSLQPAGSYNGKVKYTLVHPNDEAIIQPVNTPAGYISYNPNASDVIDNMDDQSIGVSDTSAVLWPSNFQRQGYGFAGWSETHDYSDSAKFYGPNETINFIAGQYSGTNKGLSLYAIWIKSTGSLQDWTGCSVMDVGDVTALTDLRDNQSYAIAKLADERCWMIENLRLNNSASHNTDGLLAQGYNPSFIGLANPEDTGFANSTISNSLYSTDGSTTALITYGDFGTPGYRFPRYNNQNTVSPVANMTDWDGNDNIYSLGNYYTWSAAIADTSERYAELVDATSICPKGWHLPTGGTYKPATYNDFWKLGLGIMGFAPSNNSYYTISETNATGKDAEQSFRSYPNNFIYSGIFINNSLQDRSSLSAYWSSMASSDSSSYNLYFYERYPYNIANVYPGTNSNIDKSNGLSIRCIANN